MGLPSNPNCSCYKVPNLTDPILETSNISYLQDRYILRDELGWGQFGVIRSCFDMLTGERLACKSIAKDRLISPNDLQSVKLEIEVMAKLSGHPNVVELKAVYEEEGSVHLVMELCAGGELFHRIEKCGRFSEAEAGRLFRHLMEVVVFCHENGIVHRDLKPENVLLATKSSLSEIKLADFGLATYIKPGQSLHGTVGSPFYIAPEVLAGGYNEAADVWSAGVILYILLSGMPPFWGKTKSRIFESVRSADLRFPSDPWDSVSKSAKELVAGMLSRDPTERLTGKQVLEHSWMKNFAHQAQSSYGHGSVLYVLHQHNSGSFSFSNLNVSTTCDVSFGFASPANQPDPSSPPLSSQSSFSTPATAFSFQNDSNGMDLSLPSPLVPSFSFFIPPHPGDQEIPLEFRTDGSKVNNAIQRDVGKSEHKNGEFRRANISVRSKRNRTIGLGEQLDLIVSETVIRWASCTHLPGAPSLRSSLVC